MRRLHPLWVANWVANGVLALLCLVLAVTVVRATPTPGPGHTLSRDPKQVDAFRRDHPCPRTGLKTGACPGWVVDHKKPLCAGGKDEPANMMWQEHEASLVKDDVERALCRCLARPTP